MIKNYNSIKFIFIIRKTKNKKFVCDINLYALNIDTRTATQLSYK